MKISKINSYQYDNRESRRQPNFKGGAGFLGFAASFMSGIENQGYLLSFLIQDGLGMTVPRTITGFNRDREVTGKINKKEGFEVLGREGLTGPFMIAVAPVMLFLAGKLCRSTSTNTRLIKVMGENLKELIKKPEFVDAIKKDSKKFQQEFNKHNLEKFYRETIPQDKNPEKTLEYIYSEFEKFVTGDKKIRKEATANIMEKINERVTELSGDFNDLYKLKVTTEGKQKVFSTKDVLNAIKDFGIDAIERNKNFAEIDEVAAENIKNNFATKRLLITIANIATTLGGLSVLPKIYARNDVAPGAATLLEAQKAKEEQESIEKVKENNPAFKGKGINSENIFSKLGKFLTKNVPEWFQREFEYDGHNFTPSLMACLSLFGLLLPRGMRAYERALVDENGKKDMTELNEILTRDTISSLSVVYVVPILTKILVNLYENKLGYILTNRAHQDKTGFKKFLDVINPYSSLKVLSNAELEAMYGNINNKTKMLNFCKYISDKQGDLSKILSKSEDAKSLFNEKTFTLESLKDMTKADKNNKIIDFFKNLEDNAIKLGLKSDSVAQDELISKLMKDSAGKAKSNRISTYARGLNSIPAMIATVIISPILLGVLIPKLTYANTRKKHAELLEAQNK